MLDQLFDAAAKASQKRELAISEQDLLDTISKMSGALDVYEALSKSSHIKLMAEIKRRSPSRGFLADIPSAADQAELYQNSGAHAISVLTEETGFGGKLEDLVDARTKASIPLLRKDFISTEYQILEARAAGADFILLILACYLSSALQSCIDLPTNSEWVYWLKPTHLRRLLLQTNWDLA